MNELGQIKKYAVAYLRISDKKQIDGESEETQRKVIQEYARKNNVEILAWFFDEAKSGRNTDRKELQNLLQFALQHSEKVDYIIVFKMIRASRDLDSYIVGVKAVLAGKGITIRSATEPVDDTPIGRWLEGMLILNGQLDNEIKGSTTLMNMRSLAQQGYWLHGPIIGYDKHTILNDLGKPRPTLKPNGMAAQTIQILERFADGDINPIALIQFADEVGLMTPGYTKRDGTRVPPHKLGKNGVYSLLRRSAYAGYVQDKFTDNKSVPGKHQALISPELYEHNQMLLNKKAKGKQVRISRNTLYPLKNVLLCVGCQKPLNASAPQTGGGQSHSPRYQCYRRGCPEVAKRSLGIKKAHEAFYGLLSQIEPSEGLLKLYKEVLVRQAVKENDRINARVTAKRNELNDMASTRLNSIESREATTDDKRKAELTELINHLDAKKLVVADELDKLVQQQTIQEAKVEYVITNMGNVAKQWLDADLDLRLRFQNMVFPGGATLDMKTLHFGTQNISPLYRYAPTKRDLSSLEKSSLVTPAGFEPAIFRMRT